LSCSHIRFIGGGRWATIVLTELVRTFPNLIIDWVCHSNVDKKIEFVENSDFFKNVNPVDNKNIEDLSWPDKVVIASHSSQHCSDLLAYSNGGVDILVEKPLFPTFSDFETLSEFEMQRIFINLEFYNAYFISDFYSETKSLHFENIEIFWHDPLTENRDSEEGNKYSEIYSSIFMDQLLHVMSICKLMNLDTTNFNKIKIVTQNDNPPGNIKIDCDFDGVMVSISLSRFADKRERKIVINHGMVSLDFSAKPILQVNGKFVKEISASGRMFPIAKTLTDFVNYPTEPDSFSLSLKSLISEIKFCFECEDLFINNISDQLVSYGEDKRNLEKFNPDLVYYAGIMYYRQAVSSMPYSEIHYLKGDKGVQELLRWWYK
jgi:hypothetical protein